MSHFCHLLVSQQAPSPGRQGLHYQVIGLWGWLQRAKYTKVTLIFRILSAGRCRRNSQVPPNGAYSPTEIPACPMPHIPKPTVLFAGAVIGLIQAVALKENHAQSRKIRLPIAH